MPIYATNDQGVAEEVVNVCIGAAAQTYVYHGADRIWAAQQSYDMSGGVNLDLSTFLTAQGASAASPVVVTVAGGVQNIIGSQDITRPALTVDNLDIYVKGVTLHLYSSVLGAGGAAGENGGDAIVGGPNTNRLTIVVHGSVRAGGGGGGNGGRGGYGTNIQGSWTSWRYEDDPPNRYYYRNGSGNSIRWNDSSVAKGNGNKYRYVGSYVYERGRYRRPDSYQIRRAPRPVAGVKGTGGVGGHGQGYGGAADPWRGLRTNGAAGGSGTRRAGNGGTGGAGGAWGAEGGAGRTGATGYSYADNTSARATPGALGQSGGRAGKAIDSNGGTITLLGDGPVNGEVL